MKVKVGTSTSSSGLTPAARSATWSAAVPFTVATAWGTPTWAATSRSKRSTKGPTEETQLVSRHSLRYVHSLPARCGTALGITRRDSVTARASALVPPPVPGEGVSHARLDGHLGHEAGQLTEPRDVGTAPRHRARGSRDAVEDGRDAGLVEHEPGKVLDHRLLAIVA